MITKYIVVKLIIDTNEESITNEVINECEFDFKSNIPGVEIIDSSITDIY
jgi:hypothetical protein